MVNTKDQLAETEKEKVNQIVKEALLKVLDNEDMMRSMAYATMITPIVFKLVREAEEKGKLLGTISQLKERKEFLAHIYSCENGCYDCRLEIKEELKQLTADLKLYEDKLKEMGE
jgi:hypothetical protein